jgi:hypothetical protein
MIDAVNKFQLGITVPPDSSVSIAEGMRGLLTNSVTPRWEDYEAAASWDTNVRIILEGADLSDVTAS